MLKFDVVLHEAELFLMNSGQSVVRRLISKGNYINLNAWIGWLLSRDCSIIQPFRDFISARWLRLLSLDSPRFRFFFFRPVFKRIATVMIFKTLCDKRILCVSAPVSVKTMLLLFLKCVRLIYWRTTISGSFVKVKIISLQAVLN